MFRFSSAPPDLLRVSSVPRKVRALAELQLAKLGDLIPLISHQQSNYPVSPPGPRGDEHLPRPIHVSGKLCVFDEVSFVDALLHGLPRGEVVICEHPGVRRSRMISSQVESEHRRSRTASIDQSAPFNMRPHNKPNLWASKIAGEDSNTPLQPIANGH